MYKTLMTALFTALAAISGFAATANQSTPSANEEVAAGSEERETNLDLNQIEKKSYCGSGCGCGKGKKG